jgi:anti-sigma B factor antagonist
MDKLKPKISVEYQGDIVVVTLTTAKILEDVEIQSLEETFLPLIEQNPSIRLIIDFSQVQFLTSAALGLLIRISKKTIETNGRLKLCGIQPKIMEIFKITRLDNVFDIQPDLSAAVKSLTE